MMPLISSLHNARVKQIRALASRKERDRAGLFLIEGIRAVAEARQARAAIELLVIAPDLLASAYGWEVVARLRETGVDLLEVTPEVFRVFDSVGFSGALQGLGAVVQQRWAALPGPPTLGRCWAALDAVQLPGNLGTILRTSDAIGGAGVILIGKTTDPYHPVAVQASLGTIFSQRLVRASFDELVAWKEQHGISVIGASPDATIDYRAARYDSPVVLLMGSERQGLSSVQLAACDTVVSIPMVGRGDSLNLGVATGLMLYEVFRQHRPL